MKPLQDLLEDDQSESDFEKNEKLTDEWKRSTVIKNITQAQFNILVKNTLVELEVNFVFFKRYYRG